MSFVDNQSRGWLHDDATGQHYNKNDDWGARVQLRWNAPGDNVVRIVPPLVVTDEELAEGVRRLDAACAAVEERLMVAMN